MWLSRACRSILAPQIHSRMACGDESQPSSCDFTFPAKKSFAQYAHGINRRGQSKLLCTSKRDTATIISHCSHTHMVNAQSSFKCRSICSWGPLQAHEAFSPSTLGFFVSNCFFSGVSAWGQWTSRPASVANQSGRPRQTRQIHRAPTLGALWHTCQTLFGALETDAVAVVALHWII